MRVGCWVPMLSVVLLHVAAFQEKVVKTSLRDAADHDHIKPRGEIIDELKRTVQEQAATIKKLQEQLKGKDCGQNNAEFSADGKTVKGEILLQEEPFFCKPEISNWEKWRKKRQDMYTKKQVRATTHGEWTDVTVTPTWYCDKLYNNIAAWVKPKLTPEDLVVGIFTGESLFYGRASASRDTWMLQFPHHYIFSAASDPRIPVVGLAEMARYKGKYDHAKIRHPFKVGNERMNAQFSQLLGLKEMYDRKPNQKWYFIVGCDNYVNEDYALRALEKYDHTKPYWLAQFTNDGETIPAVVDLKKWPKYQTIHKKLVDQRKFEWTSGGIGWFMSNPIVKAFSENIEEFLSQHDPFEICYCPDKITGLLFGLLGFTITKLPHEYESSMLAYSADSHEMNDHAHNAKEMTVYHYVSPRKMVHAHHRAVHEKLDRMVNAGAMQDIIDYFRRFINIHFEVVRRRQVEVKYQADKCGAGRNNFHDIPTKLHKHDNLVSTHDHSSS